MGGILFYNSTSFVKWEGVEEQGARVDMGGGFLRSQVTVPGPEAKEVISQSQERES